MMHYQQQNRSALISIYATIALLLMAIVGTTMASTNTNLDTAAAGGDAQEDEAQSNDSLMAPQAEQTAATAEEGDAAGGDKYCGIHSSGFEPLHALMDQICELCHDFFSHFRPNTRVECRSDCFRTVTFKKCLRLFKPSRTRRHLMQFLMVE